MQNENDHVDPLLRTLRKSPKFYGDAKLPLFAVPEPRTPQSSFIVKPTPPTTPERPLTPIFSPPPFRSARSWVELFQDEIDKDHSDDYKLALEHARRPPRPE